MSEVDEYIEMLKSDSTSKIKMAVHQLGMLRDERAIEHILYIVDHPDTDLAIHASAVLHSLGEDRGLKVMPIRLIRERKLEELSSLAYTYDVCRKPTIDAIEKFIDDGGDKMEALRFIDKLLGEKGIDKDFREELEHERETLAQQIEREKEVAEAQKSEKDYAKLVPRLVKDTSGINPIKRIFSDVYNSYTWDHPLYIRAIQDESLSPTQRGRAFYFLYVVLTKNSGSRGGLTDTDLDDIESVVSEALDHPEIEIRAHAAGAGAFWPFKKLLPKVRKVLREDGPKSKEALLEAGHSLLINEDAEGITALLECFHGTDDKTSKRAELYMLRTFLHQKKCAYNKEIKDALVNALAEKRTNERMMKLLYNIHVHATFKTGMDIGDSREYRNIKNWKMEEHFSRGLLSDVNRVRKSCTSLIIQTEVGEPDVIRKAFEKEPVKTIRNDMAHAWVLAEAGRSLPGLRDIAEKESDEMITKAARKEIKRSLDTIKAFRDPFKKGRKKPSVDTLVEIGGPEARDALVEYMSQKPYGESPRYLARCLAQMGDSSVLPFLEEYVKNNTRSTERIRGSEDHPWIEVPYRDEMDDALDDLRHRHKENKKKSNKQKRAERKARR